MNIKRAFLAAAAVLMMPGLALAQSTNTFDTTATIVGGMGELPATLSCNGGIPLEAQSASTPVIFSQLAVPAGVECSIIVDSGDIADGVVVTGYVADGGASSMTGCEYVIANGDTVNHTCEITAEVTSGSFNVTVDWTISPDADPDVGAGAEVVVECENVLGGSGLTTIIYPAEPAGPEAVYPIPYDVDANGAMPYTECNAVMINVESAVAVDESDCGTVTLMAGGTEECTIVATAFFEGIPTLSQYGMAIMALLMLGVGFVGFRRFV